MPPEGPEGLLPIAHSALYRLVYCIPQGIISGQTAKPFSPTTESPALQSWSTDRQKEEEEEEGTIEVQQTEEHKTPPRSYSTTTTNNNNLPHQKTKNRNHALPRPPRIPLRIVHSLQSSRRKRRKRRKRRRPVRLPPPTTTTSSSTIIFLFPTRLHQNSHSNLLSLLRRHRRPNNNHLHRLRRLRR